MNLPSRYTVALLQQDIDWANPAANLREAERAILEGPKADLYLLPEMFTTGFATEPAGIAEPADTPSIARMHEWARTTDALVAGSLAICGGENFYNRFCVATPEGLLHTYDKRHLFTYGGEHRHFTAGQTRTVFTWRGMRICLQICYDLRFPVFVRNQAEQPYDLLLYVASWPTSRRAAWDTLLRARAIENQCYVAAVNRVGTDPACQYNGGSCLIDPYGRTVAACDDDKVDVATGVVDLEALNAFRQKFPVLHDADQSPNYLSV